jgi:hypothetical protein
MVVGEAMRGKSTLLYTLKKAMTTLKTHYPESNDFYRIES